MALAQEVARFEEAIANAANANEKARRTIELHALLKRNQNVTDPEDHHAWNKGMLLCLEALDLERSLPDKVAFLREQVRQAEED
jgi:hypothetical protein